MKFYDLGSLRSLISLCDFSVDTMCVNKREVTVLNYPNYNNCYKNIFKNMCDSLLF